MTEEGILAFDKGAAICDRGVAADTDEPKGDRSSSGAMTSWRATSGIVGDGNKDATAYTGPRGSF